MQLFEENSLSALPRLSAAPDVILLDPMFPERQKSALIKKKFQLFSEAGTAVCRWDRAGKCRHCSTSPQSGHQKATQRVVSGRPKSQLFAQREGNPIWLPCIAVIIRICINELENFWMNSDLFRQKVCTHLCIYFAEMFPNEFLRTTGHTTAGIPAKKNKRQHCSETTLLIAVLAF